MAEGRISNEDLDILAAAVARDGAAAQEASGKRERAKAYDFARPEKFSKEQIRTLEMIYSSSARSLTTVMSTMVRTTADVQFVSVSETTYADSLEHTTSSPSAIALVSIPPLVGRAVFEMNPEFSFALIDRLMGGPGLPGSINREPTDIEKGLLGTVVERLSKSITESWSTVVQMRPKLDMIVGSTLFSQIALPDDRLMLATFAATFGSITGRISFGIPVTAFDPILAKLSAQQWFSGGRESNVGAHTEQIRDFLDHTSVPFVVELGRAVVSMRDLLDLQVGDVIRLDKRANAEADVMVDNEHKLMGIPGHVGRRLGVRITRIRERG